MAPTLAYWDIRGFAQPIRFMLTYAGQEFEDKYYACGPAPNFDKSCWFDIKFSLGFDFPNLPYYVDGDVKLSQSVAIMRYLADIHNLNAKTQEEKNRVYVAEGEVVDFRMEYVRLAYNPAFQQMKEDYLKALPQKLKRFSDFLGQGKWLAGATLTYIDFMFYEVLFHHRKLQSDCLQEFPTLTEYMKRFEALPHISDYVKTEKYKKFPLNNKMAAFGTSA